MQNDISNTHQKAKLDSYWENLVGGTTSAYKEIQINTLLKKHLLKTPQDLLDVGCGTCDVVFRYQDFYKAKSVACLDYDAKVIDALKSKYSSRNADWLVADAFEIEKINRSFDLIFLMDMVHEIYSFYGRPSRNLSEPISHELGIGVVERFLTALSKVTRPGGGIVITDNLVCEENGSVSVRCKTPKIKKALEFFFENYLTRKINHSWSNDVLTLSAKDFCVLLTQYNKISTDNIARWNVEKLETHQYFTLNEYSDFFDSVGFKTYFEVGTPNDAETEWNSDFEILSGLDDFPKKRVCVLAIRQ